MSRIQRARYRSRIRARINSSHSSYEQRNASMHQLIRENLVEYLGEAEPPIPGSRHDAAIFANRPAPG
ncbi:MAG: hypothetical protein ACQES4_09820 [Bacillota bacterium]